MKQNIEIFLRGVAVLTFSSMAIVFFCTVPLLFKDFMNAIGFSALWKFILMAVLLIAGCLIIFALGVDSIYPDETTEKINNNLKGGEYNE